MVLRKHFRDGASLSDNAAVANVKIVVNGLASCVEGTFAGRVTSFRMAARSILEAVLLSSMGGRPPGEMQKTCDDCHAQLVVAGKKQADGQALGRANVDPDLARVQLLIDAQLSCGCPVRANTPLGVDRAPQFSRVSRVDYLANPMERFFYTSLGGNCTCTTGRQAGKGSKILYATSEAALYKSGRMTEAKMDLCIDRSCVHFE